MEMNEILHGVNILHSYDYELHEAYFYFTIVSSNLISFEKIFSKNNHTK